MTAIDAIDEIKPGDAIVFKYLGKDDEGIVTSVTMDQADRKLGIVHIIHYASLKTWTIIEETVVFNLKVQTITKKVYEVDNFDSATVIERGRSRLGERRHDRNYNTSRHLVEWTKVGYDRRKHAVDTYMHTTGLLLIHNAYAWSDLEKGCIIEYPYKGFKHQSVVTEIKQEDNTITVIHYGFRHIFGTRTVMKEDIKIDLKTQPIRIYWCDTEGFRHNKGEVVVQKAEKRLGEQEWNIINNTNWAFCMHCLFN